MSEERRPIAGEVLLDVRPTPGNAALVVELVAPGYIASHVSLNTMPSMQPRVYDVTLVPVASIDVQVLAPYAIPYRLRLEVQTDDGVGWRLAGPALEPCGSSRYTAWCVPTGRYRVRESNTGEVSADFGVPEGRATIPVVFDLRHLRELVGRVTGPTGDELAETQVRVHRVGTNWRRTVNVTDDGTFRVLIARGTPVELEVVHPTWRSAEDGGTFVVDDATSEARLRLCEPEDGEPR